MVSHASIVLPLVASPSATSMSQASALLQTGGSGTRQSVQDRDAGRSGALPGGFDTVQHARHTTAALHAAQQQRRSLLRPRGRQPTRRTSTCVRRARPALQRCDRPWRRSPRRKAFSSRMSEGFKTTDGCGKSVRQPTTRKTQLTDPSNSVYGMIRLPQVAQHAQLHAPVVLCEDRARWIERLWVGGVAESHIDSWQGATSSGRQA